MEINYKMIYIFYIKLIYNCPTQYIIIVRRKNVGWKEKRFSLMYNTYVVLVFFS